MIPREAARSLVHACVMVMSTLGDDAKRDVAIYFVMLAVGGAGLMQIEIAPVTRDVAESRVVQDLWDCHWL